jgi:hypothetical protein
MGSHEPFILSADEFIHDDEAMPSCPVGEKYEHDE